MARTLAQYRDMSGKVESILEVLNGPGHELALRIFLAIVLAHWVEHLLQALQIFALGWPRPEARGALGLVFPWLVSSEALHYAYAIIMLVGLIVLRPSFQGRARNWWNLSLGIQVWHHFEHLLLLGQVVVGVNLINSPVPTSIAQLVFPRVELHLLYNAIVFIPMVIAMYYHVYQPPGDVGGHQSFACTCYRRSAIAA